MYQRDHYPWARILTEEDVEEDNDEHRRRKQRQTQWCRPLEPKGGPAKQKAAAQQPGGHESGRL